MVKKCAWGTCRSDTRYPERLAGGVKFIPFPRWKKTKPLNREKCLRWIKACNRPHEQLNINIVENSYTYFICSKHFVDGGPSDKYPDPVVATVTSVLNDQHEQGGMKSSPLPPRNRSCSEPPWNRARKTLAVSEPASGEPQETTETRTESTLSSGQQAADKNGKWHLIPDSLPSEFLPRKSLELPKKTQRRPIDYEVEVKHPEKNIKQKKPLKEHDTYNVKSTRKQRKLRVPSKLHFGSLQTLWSSDDENENKTLRRDNGSWDTFNMASSTGLAHRSDHSYDERDDLFFDSDDEREADIMENSDEDTEDASETDMATLEEEFTEMKEQMYQEKIKDLKHQLEQLRQGIHPEYLKKLKELEKQKEDWILMADAFREYELQEIEKQYEKERRQTKEECETKKVDLKETLIIELTEKKKNIESERMTLELTGDILEVKPVSTRKLRRRPNDPPPAPENKKRKTNAKAQLSLLLPEDNILADLKKLNKMTKNQISPSETEKQSQPGSPAVQPKNDSDDEIDHGPPFEAKIEDGKLYYEKKWFVKGQAIYLETKDSAKIIAQIHSIGTNEIWIKKIQENTRLKLYLSSLHKGKYMLRKRSTLQNTRDS